jgi:dienelactone hydrolase
MRFHHLLFAVILALAFESSNGLTASPPEKVQFQSLDGKTIIEGYLFLPSGRSGRVPAVVMMHGRGGVYSSLAKGQYDAATLSKRHLFWGRHWAEIGYVALLVDSFSTRGYPAGFSIHSYDARPEAVNEVTVRPLDAYGGLRYLRSRSDVDAARVVLQGWSNGGSATIASLAGQTIAAAGLDIANGFEAGIAFYPACGLHDQFQDGVRPAAPLLILSGDNDEEVSAARCSRMVRAIKKQGGDAEIVIYPGATHDFDEPSPSRQDVPANAAAYADAVKRVDVFVTGQLAK